jgi:CheY-like chemotaxis protein
MPPIKELTDCRVLVVDDAKPNVDMLVEALRGECKVSVALDGEAALRAVAKAPPDLVLLDIMMPGIDGYEVCRRLREDHDMVETPVVMLTAHAQDEDHARGDELGISAYVTKPFDPEVLVGTVREALSSKGTP